MTLFCVDTVLMGGCTLYINVRHHWGSTHWRTRETARYLDFHRGSKGSALMLPFLCNDYVIAVIVCHSKFSQHFLHMFQHAAFTLSSFCHDWIVCCCQTFNDSVPSRLLPLLSSQWYSILWLILCHVFLTRLNTSVINKWNILFCTACFIHQVPAVVSSCTERPGPGGPGGPGDQQ